MALALNHYFRSIAVVILVSLCASASASAHASPAPLSKHERERIRKKLARELRRNPRAVLERGFLHEAQVSEFRVPMSIRLSASDGHGGYLPSDDQMEIDWDDSVFQWPLAPVGIPAAPQTAYISGGFTAEAAFAGSDVSGYGDPGATELLLGGGIHLQSDPVTISEFATPCADGPQLATDPSARISIESAGTKYGLMNLFTRAFSGALALRMKPASSIVSTCGGTPATTAPLANTSAAPMPLRFRGTFSISPAITPDGKLRFGKISVDDSVTAQLTTFAYLRACTDASAPDCAPQQFPARIKLKRLTAEVLLGDALG
jgi:hypothetical protein